MLGDRKVGELIRIARERRRLAPEQVAEALGLSKEEYERIESGESELEEWGTALGWIAVKLSTPTSRLITETGKAADAKAGRCGRLIRAHREERRISTKEMAEKLEISEEQYEAIEKCQSPIEEVGPLLLRCAEVLDQPVFNLLYSL